MSELPNKDDFDFESQSRLIRERLEHQFKVLLESGMENDEAERIINERVVYLIEHPEEDL